MNRRIFTRQQISELLENPNVINCSDKSITYSNTFKVSAMKQYRQQYMTFKEIFTKAGFDLSVIGEDTPRWCFKRWNKTYKTKGLEKLAVESRGKMSAGRPTTKNVTDADRIKRLEMENAYLRAENDFLAKLRAKRAE